MGPHHSESQSRLASIVQQARHVQFRSSRGAWTACKLLSVMPTAIKRETPAEERQQALEAAQYLLHGLLSPSASPAGPFSEQPTPAATPAAAPNAARPHPAKMVMAKLSEGTLEGMAEPAARLSRNLGLDTALLSTSLLTLATWRFQPPFSASAAWGRWMDVMDLAAASGLHHSKDTSVQQAAPIMVQQLLEAGLDKGRGRVVAAKVWAPLLNSMGRVGVPPQCAEPVLDAVAAAAPSCITFLNTWVNVAEGLAGMGSRHAALVALCASGAAKAVASDPNVRVYNVARVLHALVAVGATQEQVRPVVAAVAAAVSSGRTDPLSLTLHRDHAGVVSGAVVVEELRALGIQDGAVEGVLRALKEAGPEGAAPAN